MLSQYEKGHVMNVGIPVELKQGEGRVSLTPSAVSDLILAGATVFIESQAGVKSGYLDEQYLCAGATVVNDQAALYEYSQLIVKVKEPLLEELPYITRKHALFCYLHLAANDHLVKAFSGIGNTAIAFELVESEGRFPLLAPMSDIAGKVAIQLGMHYLMSVNGGLGILLEGGYGAARANVVVLGGGVAGFSAASRAASIGANVTVFDIKTGVLKRANALGANVTGLYSQSQVVAEYVKNADLVVGAVLVPGKSPPVVLPESLLSQMKQGSVVIDIAIDQGGCVEGIKATTYENPCYQRHGVQMLAVTNLPGAVPKTATQSLSGAILPYVRSIVSCHNTLGALDVVAVQKIEGLSDAICIKNGHIG